MVWKSTTLMGVGKATGSNGWTYVVVSYSPRGNVQGQFGANVLPLGTVPPAQLVKLLNIIKFVSTRSNADSKLSQPTTSSPPAQSANSTTIIAADRNSLATNPLVRTSFKDVSSRFLFLADGISTESLFLHTGSSF